MLTLYQAFNCEGWSHEKILGLCHITVLSLGINNIGISRNTDRNKHSINNHLSAHNILGTSKES